MTCCMTYTTIWSIEYIWYDIWYDIYYYMDYRVHMVWECVSESIDAIIFFSLSFFPFLCVSEAIDAIKTHEDLIKVIAMLQKINVAAYWDWQVMAKNKVTTYPATPLFSTKLK